MNFKHILNEIEKADPEVYEKLSGRRHVLKSFGSKVAVAALPLALGSLFKKAYGKTTSAVTDALNFALELEYFEYNFYHMANNTGGLIPTGDKPGFATIETHEKAHINFLKDAITTLGVTPFTPKYYNSSANNPLYVPNAYDFTAGGTYEVFNDYPSFLMIASVFEDTGVHAYKGQIPALLGSGGVLTQTFQIQSVEGRHASHVRLLRRLAPINAPEYPAPWITNNIPPTVALQSYYTGEDNAVQNGITITSLTDTYSSTGMVPQRSATGGFDESLDKPTVLSLLSPFIL